VQLTNKLKPDVLLLALSLPRRSGIDVLRDLSISPARVRIVLLARGTENPHIIESLRLGAQGVLLKESSKQAALKSIRSVLAGRYWMGHESVAGLVEALRDDAHHNGRNSSQTTYGLSPRQLEIIEMIVSGSSNKDAARKFSISERTVKYHLSNIFDKLGISKRLELAVFAFNHDLIRKP
jgi:DNA-binding NarL/FixJ family response regulator